MSGHQFSFDRLLRLGDNGRVRNAVKMKDLLLYMVVSVQKLLITLIDRCYACKTLLSFHRSYLSSCDSFHLCPS